MPSDDTYLDTPLPHGDAPDYPAGEDGEAVAFLNAGTSYSVPVPEGVDAVDDAPADADVHGGASATWTFSQYDVIPAHVVPERAWKHVFDLLVPVDAEGNPVSARNRPAEAREQTDAEQALARYRRLLAEGDDDLLGGVDVTDE